MMVDFRVADDPKEPTAARYGLGTGAFNIPGLSAIEHYGHGGNGIGHVIAMLYLAQREACVVLLTNDRAATMQTTAAAFLAAVDRGIDGSSP